MSASAKPLVIAHRGARAFAPENTLAAFEKAARLGADMVELDVQGTADGQLVVVHDDTLERCANVRQQFPDRGDLRVESFMLREIRSLDAGSWFARELSLPPRERQAFLQSLTAGELEEHVTVADRALFASGTIRHPTLVESLECCRRLGLRVNVELKAPSVSADAAEFHLATGKERPGAVPEFVIELAVRQVRDLRMDNEVLISSFDHLSLERVHQLAPALRTGVLVTERVEDPVRYCRSLGAAAYHPGCVPGWDCVGFDSDEYQSCGRLKRLMFDQLREAGIAVYVWTENDPVRMRALMEVGASGIFTDFPSRGAAIVGSQGRKPLASEPDRVSEAP
jgi:glycerophosphoryl diester phosphodiesterase